MRLEAERGRSKKQRSKEAEKNNFFSLLLCLCASLLLSFYSLRLYANPSLLDQVKELTLPNGMKFLLLKRSGAPVFSGYIRVKAGGVDEVNGKTGLAHLLEHMAFKGTSEIGTNNFVEENKILEQIEKVYAQLLQARGEEKRKLSDQLKTLIQAADQYVVKEEFSKIYSRNGASDLNATTSQDLTTYFVSLPNTKLKLWAYLESSRLKDPVFREFYPERDVVQEERRTRIEDSPFGKLYEVFINSAFENSPYQRPTIGYSPDIQKLSATDLKNFYKKYYVPSNVIGAIVGDIDIGETENILHQYFGDIPASDKPPLATANQENPQREKRFLVPFDASASMMVGYPKPNLPHREDYLFDVLNEILCEGTTSRFYRRLVEKDQLVQTVDCDASTPGARLPNLFFIYGSIVKGHTADQVLRAIDEELQKIQNEGIPPEELAKAKKNILAQWNYDMQSNDDMAELLTYFEAVTGSWKYILEHQKQIQSVSSQDLQNLIQTYLKPERRTVAILQPKKKKS